MGIKVNTGAGGTTTETMRNPKLKCRSCGAPSVLLTLDANGKMVCENCVKPSQWVPATEVKDAAQTPSR